MSKAELVGYHSTGDRLFIHPRKNVYKLVSWRQRRCIFCQRFLSKKERKYCKHCKNEADYSKEQIRRKFRYYNDNEFKNRVLKQCREYYARKNN